MIFSRYIEDPAYLDMEVLYEQAVRLPGDTSTDEKQEPEE